MIMIYKRCVIGLANKCHYNMGEILMVMVIAYILHVSVKFGLKAKIAWSFIFSHSGFLGILPYSLRDARHVPPAVPVCWHMSPLSRPWASIAVLRRTLACQQGVPYHSGVGGGLSSTAAPLGRELVCICLNYYN